jgi:pyruvate kinase
MKRNPNFSRTKIVATLGPACADTETIKEMVLSGMDVVRLNFSHGSHHIHDEYMRAVEAASEQTGVPISILADLCGPKIRVGSLKRPVEVKTGEQLTITTEKITGGEQRVSTSYEDLHLDVRKGDTILIDDGLIRLSVIDVDDREIVCTVIEGGTINEHKGMNLPDTKVSVPSVTDKDKEDLHFILGRNIDYVALSFVRSSDDIEQLRSIMKNEGKTLPIVAKIEKPEALKDLEGIIAAADIVMVARGDLGVEIRAEQVPMYQKRIIDRCNKTGKPVITATQMLDSMIYNSRPTRAEVSDVANAVYDGSDAVMLSGETAVGKYPVGSVKMMEAIIQSSEVRPNRTRQQFLRVSDEPVTDAVNICRAACMMADDTEAQGIITVTRTGKTARLLSRFRPSVPIIAFTEDPGIIRYLNIVWGVKTELIDNVGDTDETLGKARDLAVEMGYLKQGKKVIYATGIPLLEAVSTNMIKIETL